jgi:hypothetical protein
MQDFVRIMSHLIDSDGNRFGRDTVADVTHLCKVDALTASMTGCSGH